MKAKDIKSLVNAIPDDADVIMLGSDGYDSYICTDLAEAIVIFDDKLNMAYIGACSKTDEKEERARTGFKIVLERSNRVKAGDFVKRISNAKNRVGYVERVSKGIAEIVVHHGIKGSQTTYAELEDLVVINEDQFAEYCHKKGATSLRGKGFENARKRHS